MNNPTWWWRMMAILIAGCLLMTGVNIIMHHAKKGWMQVMNGIAFRFFWDPKAMKCGSQLRVSLWYDTTRIGFADYRWNWATCVTFKIPYCIVIFYFFQLQGKKLFDYVGRFCFFTLYFVYNCILNLDFIKDKIIYLFCIQKSISQ